MWGFCSCAMSHPSLPVEVYAKGSGDRPGEMESGGAVNRIASCRGRCPRGHAFAPKIYAVIANPPAGWCGNPPDILLHSRIPHRRGGALPLPYDADRVLSALAAGPSRLHTDHMPTVSVTGHNQDALNYCQGSWRIGCRASPALCAPFCFMCVTGHNQDAPNYYQGSWRIGCRAIPAKRGSGEPLPLGYLVRFQQLL